MQAIELLQRIKLNKAPMVIDARTAMEFKRGHIPGAVNAPVLKLLFKRVRLPENRNLELVITCEHGPRARMAKGLLGLRGYGNTNLLEGFMENWKKAGLPLEK
jgi:rhodanese-related sulfurtransferase